MKTNDHGLKDYIDWQEFNRLMKNRGVVQSPENDSRGDSADDALIEARMGEDYPEEDAEQETVLADTPSSAALDEEPEDLLEDDVSVEASTRPDPLDDLGADSSTH